MTKKKSTTPKGPMTFGQKEFLEKALDGPVTASDDYSKRIAEQLSFRKWVTIQGNLSKELTVTITDTGRKILQHPDMKHVKGRYV